MDYKKFGKTIVFIGLLIALGAGYFWIQHAKYSDDLLRAKAADALARVKGIYDGDSEAAKVERYIVEYGNYRNYSVISGTMVLLIGFGLIKAAKSNSTDDNVRKCPLCAELIQIEAKVCRYCHRDLTEKS